MCQIYNKEQTFEICDAKNFNQLIKKIDIDDIDKGKILFCEEEDTLYIALYKILYDCNIQQA